MNSLTLCRFFGLAVLFAIPLFASAQWEQFSGPETSQIYDIENHGSYLYAGTDDGIFRSKDDGNSWVAVNPGLPTDTFFTDLVVIDGDLFSLTTALDEYGFVEKARVLRSREGSENWIEASTGLPDELSSLVAIGERLFIIGEYVDVYRSTDYGETWQAVGSATFNASDLAAQNNILLAASDEGIYQTVDAGKSWTLVASDRIVRNSWIEVKKGVPDDAYVTALVASGDNFFATVLVDEVRSERSIGGEGIYGYSEYEALFRSTDKGDSWTLLGWETVSKTSGFSISVDAVEAGGYLFVCEWAGVYRSKNGGEHWTLANSGLPADEGQQTLPLVTTLATVGDAVFAGTWDGVYVSMDNGSSWRAANFGLPDNTYVESFVVSGSDLYASLGAYGVYMSRDNAATWTSVGTGSKVIRVDGITPIGADLYANTSQGVFRTRNNRDSWTAVKPMPDFRYASPVISPSDTDIFVVTRNRVYHSTDSGNNWSALEDAPPWGINSFLVRGAEVYVYAYEQGFYRSTNSGQSWIRYDSGLPIGTSGSHLSRIGEKLFLSYVEGIFVSTNNGESWSPVNSGLPSPPFRSPSPSKTGEIVLMDPVLKVVGTRLFVTTDQRVFVFNNDNQVWTPANIGLPEDTIFSLDEAKEDLFAHTRENGTWRLRIRKIQGAIE